MRHFASMQTRFEGLSDRIYLSTLYKLRRVDRSNLAVRRQFPPQSLDCGPMLLKFANERRVVWEMATAGAQSTKGQKQ